MISWAELNLLRAWWSCCSRSAHILTSYSLVGFSLLVKLSLLHSVRANASATLMCTKYLKVSYARNVFFSSWLENN